MEEYIEDYYEIKFRVIYSYNSQNPDEINFAAQPFEEMDEDKFSKDSKYFMIYGKVTHRLKLFVGYRHFANEMNLALHQRIGELYKKVEQEFLKVYSQHRH